jgi:cystathionine beta-lyase family protein involved in aluminum resistance
MEDELAAAISPSTKVVMVQRSRGYTSRKRSRSRPSAISWT